MNVEMTSINGARILIVLSIIVVIWWILCWFRHIDKHLVDKESKRSRTEERKTIEAIKQNSKTGMSKEHNKW